MDSKTYISKLESKFKEIMDMSVTKAHQYTTEDAFAAFRTAARFKYEGEDYAEMYESLKDFMSKHVAHLYNNDINGAKISESLLDVSIYCLIASIMVDENQLCKQANTIRKQIKQP